MRINEFKEKLNKLEMQYGHKIELIMPDERFDFYRVEVKPKNSGGAFCFIGKENTFDISTRSLAGCNFSEDFKRDLLDVVVEFARTPIDERGDEKRYQYRLKDRYLWIADKLNNETTYLNFGTNISLADNIETNFCKTKFTDKKIKELVEKYDIDLNMFDKIEVEDE